MDLNSIPLDEIGLPSESPLGVKLTGNAETDSKAELSAVLFGFKQRAKEEAKRFEEATDSEFWVALCFGNRDEKLQFLEIIGALPIGTKYVDGRKLAAAMGIKLTKTKFKPTVSIRRSKLVEEIGTLE